MWRCVRYIAVWEAVCIYYEGWQKHAYPDWSKERAVS